MPYTLGLCALRRMYRQGYETLFHVVILSKHHHVYTFRVYVRGYVSIYLYLYVCIYIYAYVYICICIHMFKHMYIETYMYIYTHNHINRMNRC
jgi:hypothetical protein